MHWHKQAQSLKSFHLVTTLAASSPPQGQCLQSQTSRITPHPPPKKVVIGDEQIWNFLQSRELQKEI